MSSVQRQFIETNGIKLHVISAGPVGGRLIIFLHGFPEYSEAWMKQIEFFANLGYRVLAPDQRGYNLSDKPNSYTDYRIDILVEDLMGLLKWAGHKTMTLVGHDLGAFVSWRAAILYSDKIENLIIINVPHPEAIQKNLRGNVRQMFKSWYVFLFQVPLIPEWFLARKGAQALARSMINSGKITDSDLSGHKIAWQQPGAIHGMVNWYRAFFQSKASTKNQPSKKIAIPTLIIWGAQDKFLGEELASESLKFCTNGRLELIKDASHWIVHEKPDLVNSLISQAIATS
jgi:pimeloyl-ACP methyl ester carboxylesterase